MKAGEHGPDELYEKFHVYKSNTRCDKANGDPYNAYDERNRIGADGEFVFVLRPETNDLAAMMALRSYAAMCSFTYPELSRQIFQKLKAIRQLQMKVMDEEGVSLDETCKIIAKRRGERTNDL